MSNKMRYKAGAASVCITPNEPLWLAGYASRTAPARGKISDLYVSALALEDEARQQFVIASVDNIAITPMIVDRVVSDVGARHGLTERQLLLTSTHTHYGPECRPDKAVFFNIPDEYRAKIPSVAKELSTAMATAISVALAHLEPVRLSIRSTSVGFAHNRRRHGAVGGAASAVDVVDHDVQILECVNATGSCRAIMFGYACHNTTIAPDDLRYCGDWAGFAKTTLETSNPGATVLFIPGAGGDIDPEPRGTIELSKAYGQEIAGAVQSSLSSCGREITGLIRAELVWASLAVEPVTASMLNEMLKSDDLPQRAKGKFLLEQLGRGETLLTTYAAPVQAVRLGDELLIVALSGEPVVDWAVNLKNELCRLSFNSQSPQVWVAGYCNDLFGYLPTRRIQAEGGYEGGRASLWSWIPAPFTVDVEDRVTNTIRSLVNRLSDV